MGMTSRTPKTSEMPTMIGKNMLRFGMQHQVNGDPDRDPNSSEVDEVLSFIGNRPLRQDFLQLSRRHQAAGEGQAAEDDFHRQHRHHELGNVGRAQIKLGGADQRDAEAPKAWLSAVRCGTAVICTMPSGMPMPCPAPAR